MWMGSHSWDVREDFAVSWKSKVDEFLDLSPSLHDSLPWPRWRNTVLPLDASGARPESLSMIHGGNLRGLNIYLPFPSMMQCHSDQPPVFL
ncbi:hypothetical protein PG988_016041 [Apiospora saccharicola]